MFGRKKETFEGSQSNETLSWVIFSRHMYVMPERTLLISHNTAFQVKEWLITPFVKKYNDIVVAPDPALMVNMM